MKAMARAVMTAIVAGLLLFLADQLLQPIPVSAATAVIGGLIGLWFGRRLEFAKVSVGVVAGLFIGVGVHFYVHRTARSPEPGEGFAAHLAVDGAVGLMVGLSVLVIVMSVNRKLRMPILPNRRSRTRDSS